jgi:long-chain acyl-CoA synthetase
VAKVRAASALAHVFVVHYADLLPDDPEHQASIDVPAELLQMKAAPRELPADCEDFLAVCRSGASCPPVAIAMDQVALMTYTSGTTGLPKGAMLSFDNALFKTAATAQCNNVQADDVLLAIAPLYHIAGMLMGVDITVYAGATTVLLYRFDPLAVLQAIDRHRVVQHRTDERRLHGTAPGKPVRPRQPAHQRGHQLRHQLHRRPGPAVARVGLELRELRGRLRLVGDPHL